MKKNISFIEVDPKVTEVVGEFLTKEIDATISYYDDYEDFIDYIEENERKMDKLPRLIISRNIINEIEVSKKILNELFEAELKIPLISLGKVEFNSLECEELEDRFHLSDLLSLVIKALEITKEDLQQLTLPDYISVPIKHFYLMKEACCDIFIEITKKGNKEYIKRIHSGDHFDKEAIKKYEDSDLKEFFIPKEFRVQLLDSLLDQSLEKLKDGKINDTELIELTGDGHDILHDMISELGISTHTVKLAEGTISTIKDSIESQEELAPFLKELLNSQGSYKYRHTFMICLFAQGVFPKMKWIKKEFFQQMLEKITFVSLFHDMDVEDDYLCSINNFEHYKENLNDLSEKQKEILNKHANSAATTIQKFPHAPMGVDVIIRQHHGAANGVGFPESYSSQLTPMSILFIVLEEFTHELLNLKENKTSLPKIFKKLEDKFSIPAYNKPLIALKEYIIDTAKSQ
jgi:hypothetical protein